MERQHIFAVNGSSDFLDVIRELLEGEDYNVTTTNFVPQTFEQIAVLDPALIIIDLVVGDRSGLDLLVHIADEARTQRIPVIILMVLKEAVIGDARWWNLVMAGLLIIILVVYLINEHQRRE